MKGKPTEEDFRKMNEELVEYKKSLIVEEMNRLEGKDLNLTIGLLERVIGFKIIAEGSGTNNSRFDFYVQILPHMLGIGRQMTIPHVKPGVKQVTAVTPFNLFMVTATVDEEFSPVRTAKKKKKENTHYPDYPIVGSKYGSEAVPGFLPIHLSIELYAPSEQEYVSLFKCWYPNKRGPSARKYIPDIEHPHHRVDPKACEYFGKILKKALQQVGYTITVKTYPPSVSQITFALPSHPVMFTLLALFSGKPERIPRKLLEKPHDKRSTREKKQVEDFLDSIIQTETEDTLKNGILVSEEKRIAIVSNNPKVEAKADITDTLFSENLDFREEALAHYIKRTFGPEGLRHLLGLIIGLEENFRQGYFEWTINEHLERLGHRRKKGGAFSPDLKKTATDILRIFSSLFIIARRKEGDKEEIQGERLFSIDGFKIETLKKEIINETLKLRATDFWYKKAFEITDRQSPMYTKLLKKIAHENHRNHPHTIYLAPLLAIFWRMNPKRALKVKSLMDWCSLDIRGPNRMYHLKDLESELNYMKEADYLGDWINSGENIFPSKCREPFNCVLAFEPPKWLKKELQQIEGKKEQYLQPIEDRPPILTKEEFKRLFEATGLNQRQFANNLGISRQMVNYIIKEKKGLSQDVSDKIREVFGYLLPV